MSTAPKPQTPEGEASKLPTPIATSKELFSQQAIKDKFKEMLGKKAQPFIVSVLQVVASNELLKRADPNSVYNAAAVAATLDLPLNNQLGFAYIVPYNINVNAGTREKPNWQTQVVAQFQIGYKGYIQLAQRTGMYKTINATPVFEGQLLEEDPLRGYVFDWKAKKSDTVIGYASYFALVNGFERIQYMTLAEVQEHGKRYSKSYDNKKGLWKTDPHTMPMKTVLKLNLSKYGPMSIDMQKAFQFDQALIKDAETLDVDYLDGTGEPKSKEQQRIDIMISDAKTLGDLEPLREHADMEQQIEIARKEIAIRKNIVADFEADPKAKAGAEKTIKAHNDRIKALEDLIRE